MTTAARPRKRRPCATAARQALRLCEADLARLTWQTPNPPSGAVSIAGTQRRISPSTTRAALRAAGVPPLMAGALRRRLRLIPDDEAER
jgi:hypothetical protein